jgi:hypothetical protein
MEHSIAADEHVRHPFPDEFEEVRSEEVRCDQTRCRLFLDERLMGFLVAY